MRNKKLVREDGSGRTRRKKGIRSDIHINNKVIKIVSDKPRHQHYDGKFSFAQQQQT